MMREVTLCLLKPHVIKNPFAISYIRNLLLEEKFQVVCEKQVHLSTEQACKFYEEHTNRFFFQRLITSMTSGPVIAKVLSRENAISKWREIMGPTKVYQTVYSHPDSIRGLFGLSDTRNAAHGSDSVATAIKEIGILFPEFPINDSSIVGDNKN